ncbi:MAG: alpha/beta fold hydrolase [Candidatus Hinthialibacter antarcticus]|nr:alpha/beta fold hydrolase [Candidatus Hinthialibacter antarcticus]
MDSVSKQSRWVQPAPVNSKQTLRLFCFPFAGGGASVYRTWAEQLPDSVHVCPVQLPGRENRLSEPPYSQVAPLARILSEQLAPLMDMPFAFFGYSMGALIAYELTRELRRSNRATPVRLFLAAHRAPQLPMRREAIYHLDDEGFKQGLRHLEGTPEEVLANDELMDIMLPRLRADFTLYETYTHQAEAPLDMPLSVFGGTQDKDIPKENLAAWSELSNESTNLRMIEGNHFFINTAEKNILDFVVADLELK